MTSLFHAAEAIQHTLQTIYENPSGHLSLDINLPFAEESLEEFHADSSPLISLSDIIDALSKTLDDVSHCHKDHLATLISDGSISFIERLRHCKSLIEAYSSYRHRPSTSIYDLPPELLSHIFEESVSLAPGAYPATALRIASVCRSWRENAISHTRLWSTIAITTQTQSSSVVDGREEVLHLYLRCSGTQPLTIIFRRKRSTLDLQRRPKKSGKPEWSWAHIFVPLLRSHEARWGRLRLSRDLCKTGDIDMLFAPAEDALPNLSELKNITIPSLDRIPFDKLSFWEYPAFRNAPKLTSLAFDGLCVGQICSVRKSSFPRAQITALRIDVCPDLESLFDAMVAFPNIHDLRIYIDRPHRPHHRENSVRLSMPTVGITTQILPQVQVASRVPKSSLVSCLTWNLSCTSFVPQPFGRLHFNNLDSLLMIYHAAFDEEDDDRSLIGVDPILNVVSYSASRIQHITFSAIPISGMDIISVLQALPQLGSLIVHDPNPNDYELSEASLDLLYPIDEHLLHRLTASPSGLPFLPSLKSIELVWTQDLDEGAVMDMIESRRWCETPLERATLGKLERHINLAPTTHQRLRDLRKGGLAFSKEWS
ncbi:hypothetical protein EV421DRAFT_570599 [Armillaria borealis]|uniref:F-box domain-containing protein n=1 Tax=Armillaria borealis TaxID=47425 RepID=A0AA39JJT3_9AGAR|nr:hypothetical protein EV421DRAFT_570599 [Armillaria borealis]